MKNSITKLPVTLITSAKSSFIKPVLFSMLAFLSATAFAEGCAPSIQMHSHNHQSQISQKLTSVKLKVDHVKGDSIECVYAASNAEKASAIVELVPAENGSVWKKGEGSEFVCDPAKYTCSVESNSMSAAELTLTELAKEYVRLRDASQANPKSVTLKFQADMAKQLYEARKAECNGSVIGRCS